MPSRRGSRPRIRIAGFCRPSAGSSITTPRHSLPCLRIDSGVAQGATITPYYDSLLAKLIVWGEDRERALRRLREALAAFHLVGVANNVDFLGRLVASPAFTAADLDTGLIEREHAALFPAAAEPPPEAWLMAAAATLLRGDPGRYPSPWDTRDGWRLGHRAQRQLVFRCGEVLKTLDIRYQADGWQLTLDGRTHRGQRRPDALHRSCA